MQHYHDCVWGRPVQDDRVAFELLTLSVFQAGLSWQVVFKKRAEFAACFHDYDLRRLAGSEIDLNSAPIKNAAKLKATVANAAAAVRCADLHGGSFVKYLWSLVDGQIAHAVFDHCVTQDDLSRRVAAQLKQDGFAFLGPVSGYSFLQSIGVIHAHKPTCHAFLSHKSIDEFQESLVDTDAKTTKTNTANSKGSKRKQQIEAHDTLDTDDRRVRARKVTNQRSKAKK